MSSERQQTEGRSGTAGAVAGGILARVGTDLSLLLKTAEATAALGYLNARVRFRFTGIYRPEPPLLRNIRLFDRENPTLDESGNVIALLEGYCGITYSTDAPFGTSDARRDPRLQSHPARDSMISYVGVPLRMPDGSVWGTLCHQDVRPRVIPPIELPVLEHVAPLFASWVREHLES